MARKKITAHIFRLERFRQDPKRHKEYQMTQ